MYNSEPDSLNKINLYRTMILIRTFENSVRSLIKEGHIPARFGFYTGQEAVGTGVSAHLTPRDQIGSTHRALGHLIAKGCDLKKLMAELFARRTGFNKGKAGPYHIFDPTVGALGANGIVGGSVPMTAGYALANQFKSKELVSVAYFGEGASNQGGVQETLNLASCWKLPIVFICENSSPEIQRMLGHEIDYPQLSVDHVSDRALGYGMPGSTFVGWDVLEVYKAAGEAIKRARKGGGPTLLEFKVHQLEGNLEGRIEANEDERKFCPIEFFKNKLFDQGTITVETDDVIRSEAREKVQNAVDYALHSPEPELLEAYRGIFTEDV